MSDPIKQKYFVHKAAAKRRGIPFSLSFSEWNDIWVNSGKWEMRGVGANKYCMCRVGDKGGYNKGNVYIDLFNNNAKLANTGRIHSPERNAQKSALKKGIKQSVEHIAKRALALRNRNTQGV